MVILVNKKRAIWIGLILLAIACALLLYKPCLKKYVYPVKYSEAVTGSAEKSGLDPHLVYSVIKAESGFNPGAQSSKGAQGLMQITPQTAEWAMDKMGMDSDSDIFLPEINIAVGCWYLSELTGKYGGNIIAALAAYNAGPSNVAKWADKAESFDVEDIQFNETREYVTKILKYYQMYKKLYPEGE